MFRFQYDSTYSRNAANWHVKSGMQIAINIMYESKTMHFPTPEIYIYIFFFIEWNNTLATMFIF